MDVLVFVIIILVIFVIYKIKKSENSSGVKKRNLKKFENKEENNKSYDNDYINRTFYNGDNLRFELVVDPSNEEDMFLRNFMRTLDNEREFDHVMGPFKFKSFVEDKDETDDEDFDISPYSDQYDYETQTNVIPFKKHFLMISIPEGKFLDLRKKLQTLIIDGKEEINHKKFDLNVDVMKVEKNTTIWIGALSIYFQNSNIYIGRFYASSIENLWKNFEDFIDNKNKIIFF
ncbi:hypothetical protein OAI01_01385 [Alphaproteobacteria bacterium]|jgi:hypothetical protein|nr:hypothetical protein [Alphaproteobacteria bacterium]